MTTHIERHVNVQNQESFEEMIILMSMLNDIEWTNKDNTETFLHNAKEVGVFATHNNPGYWCFLAPRQKICGGMEIPTISKENEILSHCQWLTYSSVILPTQNIQRQSLLSHGQLRTGGINYHSRGTVDNKKILIKTILASNSPCTYNKICQW